MNSLLNNPEIQETFATLLNRMIPPCQELGLPGGAEVGLQLDQGIGEGIKQICDESRKIYRKAFSELTDSEQLSVVQTVRAANRPLMSRLEKQLAERYYVDSRVAPSLGLRKSAPFPEGYKVEEGDLTLLESVYLRGNIYRNC